MTRLLGYKPDRTDHRDRLFSTHNAGRAALLVDRALVDDLTLPPKNQLRTSSCVGQAGGAGIRLAYLAKGIECPELSARYGYRGCLNIDMVDEDQGTYLRNLVKVAQKAGIATEKAWPFSEAGILEQPDADTLSDAADRRGIRGYYRIPGGDTLAKKRALAAGMPIIGGWEVSEDFVSSDGREVFERQRPPIAGGHAMAVVGFGPSEYFEELLPTFRPNGKRWSELFLLLGSWGGDDDFPPYGHNGRILVTPEFAADVTDAWVLDVGGPS